MAGRATQSVSGSNAVYHGGVCGAGEHSAAVTAAVCDGGGGGDGGRAEPARPAAIRGGV